MPPAESASAISLAAFSMLLLCSRLIRSSTACKPSMYSTDVTLLFLSLAAYTSQLRIDLSNYSNKWFQLTVKQFFLRARRTRLHPLAIPELGIRASTRRRPARIVAAQSRCLGSDL